jgi:hypothetical protein
MLMMQARVHVGATVNGAGEASGGEVHELRFRINSGQRECGGGGVFTEPACAMAGPSRCS